MPHFLKELNKKLTIFQKLIAAFSLTILLPVALSFFTARNILSELIREKLTEGNAGNIALIANSVDNVLKRMITAAFNFEQDDRIAEIIKENKIESYFISEIGPQNLTWLQHYNSINNIFQNISNNIIDANCLIIFRTKNDNLFINWDIGHIKAENLISEYITTFTQYDNYRTIRFHSLKNPFSSGWDAGRQIITLSKPIGDTADNFLLIGIPETKIRHLLAASADAPLRLLIDESGKILSATDQKLLNTNISQILPAYSSSKKYESSQAILPDDSLVILTRTDLKTQKWSILEIMSYENIRHDFSQAQSTMVITAIISVLLFLTIAFFISRSLSRPLIQLAGKIRHFKYQGDNPIIPSRKDEIGILSESFTTMKTNILALIDDNIEKEKMKREAELEALQAQISPHFLFNTLNTIRWAALNNNPDKVSNMIVSLAKLLRMTISHTDDVVTLEEEIEIIKNYIFIIQMRHEIIFDFFTDIHNDLNKYFVPKLILQPLVENAILHGFQKIDRKGIITLTAVKKMETLSICVSDNGKGFSDNTEKIKNSLNSTDIKKLKFTRVGIENVKQRIKLNYGEPYGVSVESVEKEGTDVTLNLPLITSDMLK